MATRSETSSTPWHTLVISASAYLHVCVWVFQYIYACRNMRDPFNICIYAAMQEYVKYIIWICQIHVHMQKCIQPMLICRNVKLETSSISATHTHDLVNVYVCVFVSFSGICIHVCMCVFFCFFSCKQSQRDQRLRLIRDAYTRDLGVCIYMFSRVFKYMCTIFKYMCTYKTFTCDYKRVSRIPWHVHIYIYFHICIYRYILRCLHIHIHI